MNYLERNKCLDEILKAVTPEDEATTFLAVEYVKNYKGAIIGPIHEDGYGNWAELLPIKSSLKGVDNEYDWETFEAARKKLEFKKNTSRKCFPLKEGIVVAFEHEMVADTLLENGYEPLWLKKYLEWVDLKNEYKMKFISQEDINNTNSFFQTVISGFENVIQKHL